VRLGKRYINLICAGLRRCLRYRFGISVIRSFCICYFACFNLRIVKFGYSHALRCAVINKRSRHVNLIIRIFLGINLCYRIINGFWTRIAAVLFRFNEDFIIIKYIKCPKVAAYVKFLGNIIIIIIYLNSDRFRSARIRKFARGILSVYLNLYVAAVDRFLPYRNRQIFCYYIFIWVYGCCGLNADIVCSCRKFSENNFVIFRVCAPYAVLQQIIRFYNLVSCCCIGINRCIQVDCDFARINCVFACLVKLGVKVPDRRINHRNIWYLCEVCFVNIIS